MKILEKASNVFINVSIFLVLFLILISNLLFTSHVMYDSSEAVTYSFTPLSLILTIFLFVVLYLSTSLIRNIKEQRLFYFFVIIYTLIMLFFLRNIDDTFIRADSMMVFNSAKEISSGDFSSLDIGGYLSIYPHQLGLVTYDRILQFFNPNPYFIFIVNYLEVIIINYFGYKIADLIFNHNSQVSKMTILFEFLFLPQFFFIFFAYGLVPGLCCTVIAFYNALKFVRNKNLLNGFFVVLFITISTILRMNYLIAALAICSLMVVHYLREKKMIYVGLIIAILGTNVFSTNIIDLSYEHVSGIKISEGSPSSLWIAMGTDLDNNLRASGWYNGYNYDVFVYETNEDSEKASLIAKNKIKSNIKDSLENPIKAIRFYAEKNITSWCDPLFQSIWSGPSIDSENYMNNKFLLSLYNGEKIERICNLFMKSYLQLILITSFFFFIKHINYYRDLELLYIYLVGGFLFHIFWEAKSQYMYPYIFVLIPMVSFELVSICEKIKKKRSSSTILQR